MKVIDLDARRYKPRPAGPAQSVEMVSIPDENTPILRGGALV